MIGGALAAGGANTINCWIERDRDQLMKRTHNRPLPQGEIVPPRALAFGIVLNVVAFVLLASVANLLAAALTLSATLFYVFVYTLWLKPRTVQNIVIGGAAGAVPALVGWAAVRNELGAPAWILFAIVFFWTPAHFWALAMKYRDDYAAARRSRCCPSCTASSSRPRRIAAYATITVALTFAMTLTGDVGRVVRGRGVRARRAVRDAGVRAGARADAAAGDPVLRLVERLPDAGVRRRCRRRPRPLTRRRPRRLSRGALVALIVVSLAIPAGVLALILHAPHDSSAGRRADERSGRHAEEGADRQRRARLHAARPRRQAGDAVVVPGPRRSCSRSSRRGAIRARRTCRSSSGAQHDDGDRIAVVGVNYQDFPDDTRAFVQRLGVTFPTLIEDSTDNPVARALRRARDARHRLHRRARASCATACSARRARTTCSRRRTLLA